MEPGKHYRLVMANNTDHKYSFSSAPTTVLPPDEVEFETFVCSECNEQTSNLVVVPDILNWFSLMDYVSFTLSCEHTCTGCGHSHRICINYRLKSGDKKELEGLERHQSFPDPIFKEVLSPLSDEEERDDGHLEQQETTPS